MTNSARFFNFLKYLHQPEGSYDPKKRAILAEMRRGLTDLPYLSSHLHPYIQPLLPPSLSPWQKQTYYLIATLFTIQPIYQPPSTYINVNMGTHFADLLIADKTSQEDSTTGRDPNSEKNAAIKRRFSLLLTTHPDDLHYHLTQAIRFLKSKNDTLTVNWEQLFEDVFYWNNEYRRQKAQEKWAAQFWGQYLQQLDETILSEEDPASEA